MNRIMNNYYNLHKWNKSSDPYCKLCSERKLDDTLHALVDCEWTYNKSRIILDCLDPNRE